MRHLSDVKKRIFQLDEDSVEVIFTKNDKFNIYFGDYPDFSENPRYTPNGRPWVNATRIGCPYSNIIYDDCGSCSHFLREHSSDLIGICINDAMRINKKEENSR